MKHSGEPRDADKVSQICVDGACERGEFALGLLPGSSLSPVTVLPNVQREPLVCSTQRPDTFALPKRCSVSVRLSE
jgi:hypothetical protein